MSLRLLGLLVSAIALIFYFGFRKRSQSSPELSFESTAEPASIKSLVASQNSYQTSTPKQAQAFPQNEHSQPSPSEKLDANKDASQESHLAPPQENRSSASFSITSLTIPNPADSAHETANKKISFEQALAKRQQGNTFIDSGVRANSNEFTDFFGLYQGSSAHKSFGLQLKVTPNAEAPENDYELKIFKTGQLIETQSGFMQPRVTTDGSVLFVTGLGDLAVEIFFSEERKNIHAFLLEKTPKDGDQIPKEEFNFREQMILTKVE